MITDTKFGNSAQENGRGLRRYDPSSPQYVSCLGFEALFTDRGLGRRLGLGPKSSAGILQRKGFLRVRAQPTHGDGPFLLSLIHI